MAKELDMARFIHNDNLGDFGSRRLVPAILVTGFARPCLGQFVRQGHYNPSLQLELFKK